MLLMRLALSALVSEHSGQRNAQKVMKMIKSEYIYYKITCSSNRRLDTMVTQGKLLYLTYGLVLSWLFPFSVIASGMKRRFAQLKTHKHARTHTHTCGH